MNKLQLVREWLAREGLGGVLVPVHDEWLNEYPPACNRRAEWLTGFSGSAGLVVVLAGKAALFVDGRYTLQARAEVNGNEFKIINSGEMKPEAWIAAHLNHGAIAYDPALFTLPMLKRYQTIPGVELKSLPCPVDGLWQGRPEAPHTALIAYPERYSGEASSSKRARMAEAISRLGAEAAVMTAPDSVCWLLNIRARDVVHTPLVLAPVIVSAGGEAQLFVDAARVSAEVSAHLGNHVVLRDPSQLGQALAALAGSRVLLDPQTSSLFYREALLASGAQLIEKEDPCQLAKATKNEVELAGIREAHRADGIAVIRLLCWLDKTAGKHSVSEMDVAEKLLEFRKLHPEFVEPSFDTIAGSGANGAIVHYRASEKTNRILKAGELFLLDSGGQYFSGTTDITRTVAIGQPSAKQREHFTLVLKGHIAIATARFPAGTCGSQLDSLARQYLWRAGLDYDHGTGHGVGCFLGVHEGPQRISKRGGDAPLLAGMILSNEPGYYREGAYGIRTENLVAVVRVDDKWLGFETLTLVPIDARLIDPAMLTSEERAWLNDYHAAVLAAHHGRLGADEQRWLAAACAPI
ncbi:MAG: aminopeptidase P family protein [Alphaproteobacteria bacterium]|nr:aminopeptidase P family protein [Alphaproteobacteria bacterium]